MTTGSAVAVIAAQRARRGDRLLEIMAVVLLGIATVGTAWCGYQATRWNSEQGRLSNEAASEETEAARLFGLATQTVSYDSMIVAQYAAAVTAGDDRLVAFYRSTLVRPEFLPVIDRWEAQIAEGEHPPNLLEDRAYLDEQLARYEAAKGQAAALEAESQEAQENADDYVLTTLLLAASLFLAGITTSFRVRTARVLLLAGAALVLAFAATRLVTLPVA